MAVQTEWLEKDYYEVLGVPEEASEKDIQRAYRRLARQHHPDANPDDPTAEDRFKQLSGAYDVLGDAAKRAEYDELRRLGPMGAAGAPGGFGGASSGSGGFRVADLGDLTDLGDLFGDLLGGRRAGGSRSTAPARGRDLEAELELGFEQAVSGLTTELHLAGPDEPRRVKVRIPAGVADGQLIRLPGRGGPGHGGGPAGDLFVHVRVGSHPLFGRREADLTVTVPVTYPEAALGAEVKVPTLDGPPVTVRVPAGTRSGRTLRVKGRGAPRSGGDRGDLLVTIEVDVPRHLSPAQREAVEALAGVLHADPRAHLGV